MNKLELLGLLLFVFTTASAWIKRERKRSRRWRVAVLPPNPRGYPDWTSMRVVLLRPWREVHVVTAHIDPKADDFDDQLATAVAEAESKAAVLNAAVKA